MLKLNFEFRKGIFFIRLIGNLNKDNYQSNEQFLKDLIQENKFKYIVINTNYIDQIDLDGLSSIIKICYLTTNISNLVICDQRNILQRLLNNSFPNIKDELEVL